MPIMKPLNQVVVATLAAAAVAVPSPVLAQRDRDRDRDRGIDAGDVVAGALIVGGIAAVAASVGNDNRYDRRVYGAGSSRRAVEQCVYAAERNASRWSFRGDAQVTDIRNIQRRRDGYTVRGRIAVNRMGRTWRSGDGRYGQGWDNDYRGWNNNYRGYDAGRFTCQVEYGRVVDVDYAGIRGLR
jgi:hypothetical protein